MQSNKLNTSLFVKLKQYPSEAQLIEVSRILGVTHGDLVLNIHKEKKSTREQNLEESTNRALQSRHQIY